MMYDFVLCFTMLMSSDQRTDNTQLQGSHIWRHGGPMKLSHNLIIPIRRAKLDLNYLKLNFGGLFFACREEYITCNPFSPSPYFLLLSLLGPSTFTTGFLYRIRLQNIDHPNKPFFLLPNKSGIVRVKPVSCLFLKHLCGQYCCNHHVRKAFFLMLFPTFCCIKLFPEKLRLKYDFVLSDFAFFSCNVALS